MVLFNTKTLALELQFESAHDAVIKNAVLFVSDDQACTKEAIALGDLDLNQTDYVFDVPNSIGNKSWWLIGENGTEIVFSSNLDLSSSTLSEAMPLSQPQWPVADVQDDLRSFNDLTTLVSFGVMSDTHYYSHPYGWGHPLERQDPEKYDLESNIEKMGIAFDLFDLNSVDFATILGDLVEDHAGWDPTAPLPGYTGFTLNGALYSNLGNLQSFFDQYLFDTHIVIGNHDASYGTRRTDIYNNLSYYSQELYDNDDYANRMDYTFDVNGVRFIVFDNVNPIPVPIVRHGFRWASPATLNYLESELEKVSIGNIDEGMPVILMSHARIDCLSAKACSQKIDITDKSRYQWVQSSAGTNEYYLTALDGGDPNLEDIANHNQFIWVNNQVITTGTIGELPEDRWNYGRNNSDPIGFDTIYVRLKDPVFNSSYNPNHASTGYIHYKYISEGASENFEDQMAIVDAAYSGGANIVAALSGHHHISDHNSLNGIEYFTFSSPKTAPTSHALVQVLYNGTLYVEGYGEQTTYNSRIPYYELYNCTSSLPGEFSSLWTQLASNHSVHSTADSIFSTSKLWRFGSSTQSLATLSANIRSSGKVYENAEDGSTSRWEIYDTDPSGATVNNVYDDQLKSQTIEFRGDGYRNGYVLRNADSDEWNDATGFHLQWSMKYDDTYFIRALVKTTDGSRYLRYAAVDHDGLESTGKTISFGLGSHTQDGQWRTFTRDLKADLALAQPELEVLEVLAFYVQGSGQVDDIKLHYSPPATDSDNDGISDDTELNVYQTDPYSYDTDSDGISDGIELIYWEANWNFDFDNDGLNNLLDPDSDQDGASDGLEIDGGSDPGDPTSIAGVTLYEDAEDGSVARWQIYDDDPSGALVSNTFDEDRQSLVIEFDGDSYRNSYVLLENDLTEWRNTSDFILEWSMKYEETYIVKVKLKTNVGNRYLRYTASDTHSLGSGITVSLGLGSTTQDGVWHTFSRDLKADLALAQPSVEIYSVEGFIIKGDGRVDDIKLHEDRVAVDLDYDGISNIDEQELYQTSPELFDSDGDGVGDGDELLYWGASWSDDDDFDGLINILDSDSDNDGFSDGAEVAAGYNPASSTSFPLTLTVYEDAEDGSVVRWEIYDDDPTGALIASSYDTDRASQVIEFDGDTYRNSYVLRNGDLTEWQNTSEFVLEWSMNYNETYIFQVKLSTSAGTRYLRYTAVDSSTLGDGLIVSVGLGSTTQDGVWHTFARDLKADLATAQPSVEIYSVDSLIVKGDGKIDDVKLRGTILVADPDRDGISAADEQDIYLTSSALFDSDNDGLGDGDELLYWGASWNDDQDFDGTVNLLDYDSDNDGFSDGEEVAAGYNPADPISLPSSMTVYEDAEDGSVARWEISDNDPSGAIITNTFDSERQSHVIQFDGDVYRNSYVLRKDDLTEWSNSSSFLLQWSMKYDNSYVFLVKLKTSVGNRYLRYTADDSDNLGSGLMVSFGLGSATQSGVWHTFSRDLKADLLLAQPSVEVHTVEAFFLRGNGRVDDIKLSDVPL